MKINQVILKPVLTEKATNLTKGKVFMFEVGMKVNKHKVKTALEQLYKVTVGEVRMMIRKGKVRKAGRRMKSKRLSNSKIAYVVLKEGTIDLFPQT